MSRDDRLRRTLEEVKIEGVEVGLVQSRTRPRGVTRTESPTSPDSVTSVYSHEAAEFESIHASLVQGSRASTVAWPH
jgi:hypothetical protein